MKKLKILSVLTVVIAVSLLSCKKRETEITPLASLQVVNAVTGGEALKFGTNAATIAAYSATTFGVLTGNHQVKLETSGTVYYDKKHDFVNGGLYSLFLGGTPAAVEPVFVKEENVVPHTENVFGLRVINLAAGSGAVSVNLAGAANGSLIPGIAYKAISDFKKVPAVAEEGDKTFEFRNAETGKLLASFDVPNYDLPRFRNITLVLTKDGRIVKVTHY